jgi:Protein of unknown function (DUF1569)
VTTRRHGLTFATLADAVADAEQLSAAGYTAAGKWTLSQVCDHLADWLSYSMDGFPMTPVFVRPVLWLMRQTVGQRQKAKLLAGAPFPVGGPTLPQSVHPPGDDAAAVGRFKETAARFDRHTGPTHPSPLFGPLTKDEVRVLHTAHAAHHLSFLSPK